MTAYVNVHGRPLEVSARDAVLQLEPRAIALRRPSLSVSAVATDVVKRELWWQVRRTPHTGAAILGTGATEESAWREAWSRILAEEVKRGR